MADVEETLKRIQSQKGVQGVIIVNSEGIPIKTTLDNTSTVQYAGLIQQLVLMARSTVRELDPQNDLTFLRVRSKKNEIMIAPGEGRPSKSGQAHRNVEVSIYKVELKLYFRALSCLFHFLSFQSFC
uniref:Dynein light chain roadblock-type 1 n=1 Tax=Oryzias latipes TaxID=8090 RepID=A0A3P9KHP5_ORYLA